MTICNTLNVKLCNLQPNILKSEIKNDTEVTLNFSLKLIESEANDETSFDINYYKLIHKFEGFTKLFQMAHQLIQNHRKLNCLR